MIKIENKKANFCNIINERKKKIINLKIFFDTEISQKKIKNIISLSFPGYPIKKEQTIFSTFPVENFLTRKQDIFKKAKKIPFFFKLMILSKKDTQGKKTQTIEFAFEKFEFKKSFLFSNYHNFKKINFFSESKKFSNPYCIYKFEDFVEKNFENFVEKKIKKDQKGKENVIFFYQKLLTEIFKKSKKFVSVVIENLKNKKVLGFQSFLILNFLFNPKLFSFFIFTWNYLIFIILKNTIIIILKNTILGQNDFLTRPQKGIKQSWFLKKFLEIFTFFNGAIRSLNMLTV